MGRQPSKPSTPQGSRCPPSGCARAWRLHAWRILATPIPAALPRAPRATHVAWARAATSVLASLTPPGRIASLPRSLALELPAPPAEAAGGALNSAGTQTCAKDDDDAAADAAVRVLKGVRRLHEAAQLTKAPMPNVGDAIAHFRQRHADRFQRRNLVLLIEGRIVTKALKGGCSMRRRARLASSRPRVGAYRAGRARRGQIDGKKEGGHLSRTRAAI